MVRCIKYIVVYVPGVIKLRDLKMSWTVTIYNKLFYPNVSTMSIRCSIPWMVIEIAKVKFQFKAIYENCRWLRPEITTKLYGKLFVIVDYCVVNHRYSYFTTNNQNPSWSVNPYPWIFGTLTERHSWKKIQNHHWWHHS